MTQEISQNVFAAIIAILCSLTVMCCCIRIGIARMGEEHHGNDQNQQPPAAPETYLTPEERHKVILAVLKRSKVQTPVSPGRGKRGGGEKHLYMLSSSTELEEAEVKGGTLKKNRSRESVECDDGPLDDAATAELSRESEDHDDDDQAHTATSAMNISTKRNEEHACDDEGQLDPDDSSCSICLSTYKKGDVTLSMSRCNHTFHEECLMQWLDRTNECPYCRKEFASFQDCLVASRTVLTFERFIDVFGKTIAEAYK